MPRQGRGAAGCRKRENRSACRRCRTVATRKTIARADRAVDSPTPAVASVAGVRPAFSTP
ncbi:hypothetical protein AD428_23530 [Achromobacter sp. DMS1]|nr:hypothetical protein AD428_23530 [Achromobacter sp. DMS1]